MEPNDSVLPKPKTVEQLQRELEVLRRENPPDYAARSARVLVELEKRTRSSTRFAET